MAASVVLIKPSSRTINREAVRICWIKGYQAWRRVQKMKWLYNTTIAFILRQDAIWWDKRCRVTCDFAAIGIVKANAAGAGQRPR